MNIKSIVICNDELEKALLDEDENHIVVTKHELGVLKDKAWLAPTESDNARRERAIKRLTGVK